MTKQEIKDAIVKGIAGQGTNVDGGGYLPKILDAIVDLLPEGGAVAPKSTITVNGNFLKQENLSAKQMADFLGITMDELLTIQNQSVIHVMGGPGAEGELTRVALLDTDEGFHVVFGGKDLTENFGISVLLYKTGSLYSVYCGEV